MRQSALLGALVALMTCVVGALAEDREDEGRQAYQDHCARCHDTGVMGAPLTSKTADWDKRSDLWEAVLFEHAEKGYISMPARGGTQDASSYEVEAAAEYMIKTAKPDHPSD